MQKTLLPTKLTLPSPRQALVQRPALMAALAHTGSHALTLLSAPPGYGKTTLVSSWLVETSLPFTWLSLDESDNDPTRFLEYLLTALHKVVPAIQPDMLELLQDRQVASLETLAALLANATAGANHFYLVCDDFHVIQAPPVLDLFAFLLDHLPPVMHLVLLSRTDPPLPLARLRARGQLLEIRAEQLRFSIAEVARFFQDIMGLNLSEDNVSAIEARTEGWVAGLQLAGLAIQSGLAQGKWGAEKKEAQHFIDDFTGSHAYIMDYLMEEVLLHQPDPVRSFLLRTSILERMCGNLCEAVLQNDPPADGQAMLEAIEQNHLFVIALDRERRWFRYHHLFAEMLNRRLETQYPEQLANLHRRASEWYEQQGFIHEAISHAIKSNDTNRIAQLVETHGCALIMAGEVVTLAGWLAAIDAYTHSRPWLAMQKSWALLLTGQMERAHQAIQAGELLLSTIGPSADEKTLLGSFAAARALWANTQGKPDLAAGYARRAIDFLKDNADFSCSLRGFATSLLGDASWVQGKMDEAQRAYQDAVQIGQTAGNPHMLILSSTNLADVWFEQGQIHQAAGLYTRTLQMAERIDGPRSSYAQAIYFGLGKLFYAWNRLDEAASAIEQCSRLAKHWGSSDLQAACLVLTARVEQARGNFSRVQEAMLDAESQVNAHSLSGNWLVWVEAGLARLWLEQGKPEPGVRLVHRTGICPNSLSLASLTAADLSLEDPVRYPLMPAYLILVRLLLASGNPDAALALCKRLLEEPRANEWVMMITELLILQALAFQSKKETACALDALEKALALAWTEQSRRVFLDERDGMARLLYLARAHHVGGEFVTDLLSGLGQPARTETSPGQALPARWVEVDDQRGQHLLVEPLSARELEILQRIAEGCSNQEIAEQFVISPKTVKRHLSNLYAKLEAKNRTQAVALARMLKLID